MLKELLTALILGALLGFGLTGGYYAYKKNQSNPQPKNLTQITVTPNPSNSPQLTPEPTLTTSNFELSIDEPLPDAIVSNSKVTLKGSFAPQGFIIINTLNNTYSTTADNAGNFSIDIEVDSGANIIKIDAFDKNDNQISSELTITYSTAKI
ncbi:MAG TPA: hypothetical protein PK370_00645 [Candidatus Woesebacteria bacterium]|nr:hypothetical protein [Candidatus Woesebacteria bacterium]HPJ17184.1 hypothetical protein [Candidatus Woesebacteria bacterium]